MLIVKIPKGFFPQQDTGAITGAVQGPQDTSFPAMTTAIQQIGGVIKKDPAVAECDCVHRRQGATNTGFLFVALKPWTSARSAPRRSSTACARN